jgi:hypothetical protein
MIPAEVMAECRAKAQANKSAGRPVNRWAAGVIIAIWLMLAALGVWVVIRWMR